MKINCIELYRRMEGDWRWRVMDSRNVKILAMSSEGYRRRGDALACARRVTGEPLALLNARRQYFSWRVRVRA